MFEGFQGGLMKTFVICPITFYELYSVQFEGYFDIIRYLCIQFILIFWPLLTQIKHPKSKPPFHSILKFVLKNLPPPGTWRWRGPLMPAWLVVPAAATASVWPCMRCHRPCGSASCWQRGQPRCQRVRCFFI